MADKEYIERGALLNQMMFEMCGTGVQGRAMDVIRYAPAADVVEVVHGEWISVEGDVIWKCSLCDAEISTSWDYENEDMFKYCPCCGAKMDGKRKEQT